MPKRANNNIRDDQETGLAIEYLAWDSLHGKISGARFSAQESSLGRIPEYIERFEAVRDAVPAAYDLAFMQATHPRLGATAGVNGSSKQLLRDITCYGHDSTPKRAPWV
jgi:hypothetical protein